MAIAKAENTKWPVGRWANLLKVLPCGAGIMTQPGCGCLSLSPAGCPNPARVGGVEGRAMWRRAAMAQRSPPGQRAKLAFSVR